MNYYDRATHIGREKENPIPWDGPLFTRKSMPTKKYYFIYSGGSTILIHTYSAARALHVTEGLRDPGSEVIAPPYDQYENIPRQLLNDVTLFLDHNGNELELVN